MSMQNCDLTYYDEIIKTKRWKQVAYVAICWMTFQQFEVNIFTRKQVILDDNSSGANSSIVTFFSTFRGELIDTFSGTMTCWYSRDWPAKFAILLLIARVTRHVQTTRHLSIFTRLESIYYTGWVIRTGAIREKRLLIKLSFTRVNYPDGTSGKLIAIVEALFVRAVSRLINVTALLRNRRFSFAYKYLCFLDLHFLWCTSNMFSFDVILYNVESWASEIASSFAKIISSHNQREIFYYLAENVYLSTIFW